MARKCIFDGQGPLTLEHAIPVWTRDYLPGEGKLRHGRSGKEWQSEALTVTVKRACKGCNEGWMSRLEGRAKPLLTNPIQMREQKWTPREQRAVATWAYKTALMCGLASGHSHVPEAHFRHLRKNLHPPGRVLIWTAAHGAQPGDSDFQVAGVQSRGLSFEGKRTGLKFSGYVITVNVGHFTFQVFGHGSRQHLNVSPPDIGGISPSIYEVRIWPTQPTAVSWPPTHEFDRKDVLLYSQRLG